MINIKTEREITLMKHAGQVLANLFRDVKPILKAGVSSKEIDEWIEKYILDHDCIPAEKGYYGYPASSCISVNETLIHGIPSSKIILHDGDIVSIDVVVTYQGYSADACRTFPVGPITERAQKLIDVTKQSFFASLNVVKPGSYIGDISASIQDYVESHGYNVVREFSGHGIGLHMHEDPNIPNYGKKGSGEKIVPNMALCIEPMVLEGKSNIRVLSDGWSVKSKDGKLTAHYENTVIVTNSGYEIITMYEGEE